MKNRKTMAILSLACTAFLLTACGHKDSMEESASSSSVKVEKTKSSSMTKSSSKDKMATGKSSIETKASTLDKIDKTQTPASSSAQTPVSSQATTQTSSSSQTGQASQNAQTTSEPGKGVANTDTPNSPGMGVTYVTSGTLYLDQAVPAYTGTNKDLGAVYTIPAGSIFWDQYLVGDDGNYWYSYMGYDGNRYYIAYEDAKQ